MEYFLLSIVLLFALGCNDKSVGPDQVNLKLDEAFELKVGQTATVNGFALTFSYIANDSRCPKNVECFWPGNAAVVLTFSDEPDTLNTSVQPHEIAHNGYIIRLIELSPYPEYPQVIQKDNYAARLVVRKI